MDVDSIPSSRPSLDFTSIRNQDCQRFYNEAAMRRPVGNDTSCPYLPWYAVPVIHSSCATDDTGPSMFECA